MIHLDEMRLYVMITEETIRFLGSWSGQIPDFVDGIAGVLGVSEEIVTYTRSC